MKFSIHNKRTLPKRGFTLVETLVSVTLLLLVIVGPMSIASRGMQNAYLAGNQTTATFLAQEAIEYIQRLRDDVALGEYQLYSAAPPAGGAHGGDTWSWYTALNANCKDADGCDYDFGDGSYEDCSTPSRCLLNRYAGPSSNLSKVYTHTTGGDWIASLYTRRIRLGAPIQVAGVTVAVPVTVTVQWATNPSAGGTRTITLQTYLYDHYTRFE